LLLKKCIFLEALHNPRAKVMIYFLRGSNFSGRLKECLVYRN
jgi:sRNA-binding regulator protein Hfq